MSWKMTLRHWSIVSNALEDDLKTLEDKTLENDFETLKKVYNALKMTLRHWRVRHWRMTLGH